MQRCSVIANGGSIKVICMVYTSNTVSTALWQPQDNAKKGLFVQSAIEMSTEYLNKTKK